MRSVVVDVCERGLDAEGEEHDSGDHWQMRAILARSTGLE
jgi:hypothetical protein